VSDDRLEAALGAGWQTQRDHGSTVIVPIPVARELLPRLLEGIPCTGIRLVPPADGGGSWSLEVTAP
jgi:hypothetical protein